MEDTLVGIIGVMVKKSIVEGAVHATAFQVTEFNVLGSAP